MRGQATGVVASGSERRPAPRGGPQGPSANPTLADSEPPHAEGDEPRSTIQPGLLDPPGPGDDTISGDTSASDLACVTDERVELLVAPQAHRIKPRTIDIRSLVFDPAWYLAKYADVAVAQLDPVQHYLDNGSLEGRDPNPFFSTSYYCEHNPDVVASKMNPFLHYILYGAREGRAPRG